MNVRLIALAPLLISIGLMSGCTRSDPGRLEIQIVTPSREDSFVSTDANVPLGGDVGGWSTFDPAPTVFWKNTTTGASGETGPLLGTWAAGPVSLVPGANRVVVWASNGVQDDGFDSITVTYQAP